MMFRSSSRSDHDGDMDACISQINCPLGNLHTLWKGPRRLFLEKRAWPDFSWPIFAIEFVRQSLYPLTLPFYLLNPNFGTGQLYLSLRIPIALVAQNVLQPMAWAAFVYWLVARDDLKAAGITTTEALSPILIILAHRLCVATKYALLSESEYLEFQQADSDTQLRWLGNMQLLTSWVTPTLPTITFQSWMAARQHNVDLLDLHFEFDNDHRFREYVEPTNVPQYRDVVTPELSTCTSSRVSVLQVLVAATVRAQSSVHVNFFLTATTVIAVARSVVFGFERLVGERSYKYLALGDSLGSAFVALTNFAVSLVLYQLLLRFLFCGAVDGRRRLKLVRDVGEFIRVSEERVPDHPLLPVKHIQNIRAWIELRRMAQRLGYSYSRRLAVYTAIGGGMVVVFVLMLFGFVLGTDPATKLRGNPQFIHLLLDALVTCVPLFLMLAFGVAVNARVAVDKESMISHRVQTRMQSVRNQHERGGRRWDDDGDEDEDDRSDDDEDEQQQQQQEAREGAGEEGEHANGPNASEGVEEGEQGAGNSERMERRALGGEGAAERVHTEAEGGHHNEAEQDGLVQRRGRAHPPPQRSDTFVLTKSWFLQAEHDDIIDDLFDTAIQAVDSLNLSSAVHVLGIRAETRTLVSALTVAASVLAFFLQLVYFPNAQ